MLEIGASDQGLDARIQLLGHDDGGGSRVLGTAQELLREVHGIERHHHGIRAQDSIVGDHELRAVLHEQEHAVALSDSAALLQETRDALCFVENLAKGDRGIVEHEAGLVRMTSRRHLEVVKHIGGRQVQVVQGVIRPELEMFIRHSAPHSTPPRRRRPGQPRRARYTPSAGAAAISSARSHRWVDPLNTCKFNTLPCCAVASGSFSG
jgi:hypothetical protein